MRRLFRLSRPASEVSRDLSSELQFHLEMRTQELIAGGLAPEVDGLLVALDGLQLASGGGQLELQAHG